MNNEQRKISIFTKPTLKGRLRGFSGSGEKRNGLDFSGPFVSSRALVQSTYEPRAATETIVYFPRFVK